MGDMVATVGRPPVEVNFGENTAEALRAATRAQSAAQVALAAGGIGEYANPAAGLAGTAIGETFWDDQGNGTGLVYRHDPGPVATLLRPFIIDPTASGAAALIGAVGGTVQALLDASLQTGKTFTSVVTTAPGDLAGWVLTTTPTPGEPRDGILIYHEMDDPSNGLHVLATSNPGCTGGQAIGGAMDGGGTGSAGQFNRREAGTGNGVNGNRVGTGNGYGLSGQFSSTGTGAGVQAIKQNSGVTGTAGTGPALLVENSSLEGHAIDSATALVNATDTSHRFTRLQREGINADFRMSNSGARAGATSVVRVVLMPGAASTGVGAVTAFEALVGANINGAVEVNGFAAVMDGSGNTTTHAVLGIARGANGVNYGGRFGASGGATNIPLRVDGQSWLLGNIQGSLPEYANDAAASATLQIGYWYVNSTTGAVTARRV